MKPLELHCPNGGFDLLHDALNKSREGTAKVPVSRIALKALLVDHARCIARLEEVGENIQHFPEADAA